MKELILQFESEDDLTDFVANLLDGDGENMANYSWADGKTPWKVGVPILVKPWPRDDDEY